MMILMTTMPAQVGRYLGRYLIILGDIHTNRIAPSIAKQMLESVAGPMRLSGYMAY